MQCTQASGDTSLGSLLIYARTKSKTKHFSKNKTKNLILPNTTRLILFANNLKSHAMPIILPLPENAKSSPSARVDTETQGERPCPLEMHGFTFTLESCSQ